MIDKVKKSSFIIFASLFLTHAILLVVISSDLREIFQGNPESGLRSFKTIFYFLLYCFFPPCGYFALMALVKKSRVGMHLVSALYLSLYFSWVLLLLIYRNYAGVIPKIKIFANPQEITSVIYHVYHQFIGPKEWVIFGMMLASLAVSILIIKNRSAHFVLSKQKIIFLSLFFILNLKGPVQYSAKKMWPWQMQHHLGVHYNHMLENSEREAFRQGFLVYYLWHYSYDKMFLAHGVHKVAYPGLINKSAPAPNKIKKKKYNVITIQVESLAEQVIDMKTDSGLEVTPFLNSLKKKSLYFSNYYSQHGGGHSGDAELALFTGLLPVDTHQGLSTARTDYIRKDNLISILKNNGYVTAVLHSHDGGFFRRTANYAKIGVDYFYDAEYYHGDAVGGLYETKDMDFLIQSVPKIKSLQRPFYAHLITLQSHGPFRNYDKKTLEEINFSGFKGITRDYLVSTYEVDRALEKFFESMEREGLLENTIVLIYGDHAPGMGVAFQEKCPDECVPLFVYAPQAIAGKEVATLGTHLDLAPTILDILGIVPETAPRWFGSSLLSNFPYGQVALLPRSKGLVLEENGVVRKMESVGQQFLKFYHYSQKIFLTH